MKAKQAGKRLTHILLITAGTAVLAFGVSVFMIPFELVTGGVSGLAIVLAHLFPFDLISVDAWVAILTWVCFLIGLVFLGRSFVARTLLSTVLYPPLLSLFLRLADPDMLGGFFVLPSSPYPDVAILLATVGGGAVMGLGCALTFLGGGSTGGSDVLAFVICKYTKNQKLSTVIFLTDAVIILLGVIVIRDFVLSCLGVISARMGAFVIERILARFDS